MRRLMCFLSLALLICQAAFADERNQIPSCYAANGLDAKAAAPVRDITILIDQTTLLDEPLKRSIMQAVGELFVPGISFSVIRFSAYAQGRYTSVSARGVLEPPLGPKARNAIGVNVLKRFDACMGGQLAYGRKMAAKAINEALSGASSDLAKSDIFSALREASAIPRQSPAKDRLLILVSDMLENSAVTSFYANGAVRTINPEQELHKAEKGGLLADFGGARVYVIGAGLVAADTSGKKAVYRDPKTMRLLADFWAGYFGKSGASLAGFGQPELLTPIR